MCGGPNRLNVWNNPNPAGNFAPGVVAVPGYVYYGCLTDNTGARTLAASSKIDPQSMTIQECASFCSGSTYFGLEYGQECYCGNTFDVEYCKSKLAVFYDTVGNEAELCGAGVRLLTYRMTSN